MSTNLGHMYGEHHTSNRERGFSILKNERGMLLRDAVGKGKKVLDIGCRDGALTKFFAEGNEVLGVDIDEQALARAKKALPIETTSFDLNGDWHELGNQVFDAVVAGEVLEHLYHPEKVATRAAGRLKTGGVFAGSVPNAFSLKNRLRYLLGRKKHTPLSDPTHINHFHADELQSMLGRHFSQVKVLGLGRYRWLSSCWSGLFAFDLFFVCRK